MSTFATQIATSKRSRKRKIPTRVLVYKRIKFFECLKPAESLLKEASLLKEVLLRFLLSLCYFLFEAACLSCQTCNILETSQPLSLLSAIHKLHPLINKCLTFLQFCLHFVVILSIISLVNLDKCLPHLVAVFELLPIVVSFKPLRFRQ